MKAYAQGLMTNLVFDTIQGICMEFRAMKHIWWFVMCDNILRTTMFRVQCA